MWKNYNTVFVLLFLVFVSMPVTTARAAGGGSTTVTVNNVEFKDVSVRSSTDYTISFDRELLQVSLGASGHSYKDVTLFDVFIAFLNSQKNNQGQQVIYHHFEENGKYITGGYLEYRTDFGKVEYKISDTNRLKYAIIQTSGSVKTCLKYGDIPTDDSILIAPEFLVGTKIIFYFGSPDTILRKIEKAVDEFAPGYDDATNPKHPVTVKDVTLTTTDDALGLVMFAARNLEVNPAEFLHVTVYDVLTAFLEGQNLTYEFGANYAETHINSVSIKGPSLTITPDMEINLQYAIIRTEKGQKTCLKYGDIPRHDSIAVTPELCENCEIYFILGRDREKNLAYIKNKVNGFSPDYEDFPPPENLLAITSENYMENMDLLGPFFEKRQFHIAKGEPLTEDVTSFYEYYDPDTPPAVREESAVSFDGERFHVYLGNRYVYLRSAATSFETLELDTDTGVLSASANEKRYDLSFSGSSYHIQEHDLRTGSVVKEQYYYLQEDGVTSSFYAEYPEHPTRPGAPVEPDPDLTESQGLLLASTATVLSFSMLILNRIAQDPILSFWLACSLVGIGIYVVYRIRNAID